MSNDNGIKSLIRHFATGGATDYATLQNKWNLDTDLKAGNDALAKQDWASAAEYFKKSAEAGNGNAQSNLGVLYSMGRGVARNDVEGAKWLNIAGQSGYIGAKGNLDTISQRMTDSQKAEASKLATDWFTPKASPANNPFGGKTTSTPTANPFAPQEPRAFIDPQSGYRYADAENLAEDAYGSSYDLNLVTDRNAWDKLSPQEQTPAPKKIADPFAGPAAEGGAPTKYSFLEGDKYANTYDANDQTAIPKFENQINSILGKSDLTADDYFKLAQGYAGAAGSKRANIIRNNLDSAYSNSSIGDQYNSLNEMNLAMGAYQKAAAMGSKDAQTKLDAYSGFGVKASPANNPFGEKTTSTAAPEITSTPIADPFGGETTSTAAPEITSKKIDAPVTTNTAATISNPISSDSRSTITEAKSTPIQDDLISGVPTKTEESKITSELVNPFAKEMAPVSTTANTAATMTKAAADPITTVGPKVDQPWTTPSPDAGKFTPGALTEATKPVTPTYEAKAAGPVKPVDSMLDAYNKYLQQATAFSQNILPTPPSSAKMDSYLSYLEDLVKPKKAATPIYTTPSIRPTGGGGGGGGPGVYGTGGGPSGTDYGGGGGDSGLMRLPTGPISSGPRGGGGSSTGPTGNVTVGPMTWTDPVTGEEHTELTAEDLDKYYYQTAWGADTRNPNSPYYWMNPDLTDEDLAKYLNSDASGLNHAVNVSGGHVSSDLVNALNTALDPSRPVISEGNFTKDTTGFIDKVRNYIDEHPGRSAIISALTANTIPYALLSLWNSITGTPGTTSETTKGQFLDLASQNLPGAGGKAPGTWTGTNEIGPDGKFVTTQPVRPQIGGRQEPPPGGGGGPGGNLFDSNFGPDGGGGGGGRRGPEVYAYDNPAYDYNYGGDSYAGDSYAYDNPAYGTYDSYADDNPAYGTYDSYADDNPAYGTYDSYAYDNPAYGNYDYSYNNYSYSYSYSYNNYSYNNYNYSYSYGYSFDHPYSYSNYSSYTYSSPSNYSSSSYSYYYYYGYASGGLISGEERERKKRKIELKKRKYAEGGGIAAQYYAMGGNTMPEDRIPGPEGRLTPQQIQQMGLLRNTYAAGGTLLRGEGDGMSDSIPAVINGEEPQRAALADGEFVVPADVVSHLGNGSTEAGSRTLYDMMDRIRMARTGTKEQAPEIDPNEFLPE